MRVLQGPIEIAGQMGKLSKGLKGAGVESIAYNYFHTYLGYTDHVHNIDGYELELMVPDAVHRFDLFHFHYGYTMAPEFVDLPLLHSLGKPVVMHHWGNDVRTHALASLNNPWVFTEDSPPAEKVDESLRKLTQYIKYAIVQDYEVYPYVAPYYKKVFVLPIAFDVSSVTPSYPSTSQTNPLIIHAPTNPAFKGTAYIEDAIKKLQHEGFTFRYKRIEKMSNAEALSLYKEADIVVDQILCGSYGMFAVETMSLGKAVVGYIREDLVDKFPEVPPIVSANPTQIYQELKQLIQHPELRNKIGKQGRKYVENHHDLPVVTKQLLKIYKQVSQDR